MLSQPKHLPRHIFLSYSRADSEYAQKLLRDIEAIGLQTWIDQKSIEPGTPNWEQNIREAITKAFAIILICSPNTIKSQYIQAELKLAEKHGCTILPIWVSGTEWIDCVPLGLVNAQYIDCRDDLFYRGVKMLQDQLRKVVREMLPKLFVADQLKDCPTGVMPIVIPRADDGHLDTYSAGDIEHAAAFGWPLGKDLQIVVANPELYGSIEELLHDLYTLYLRRRFAPYTYGCDWVLAKASHYVTLLALPWEWLKHKREGLLIDSVDHYRDKSTPLSAFGIGGRSKWGRESVWTIIDSGFDMAYGLFTSSEHVAAKAFESITKGLSFTLNRMQAGTNPNRYKLPTAIYSLKEINPENYKYKLVIIPDTFSIRGKQLPTDAVFVVEE